jgi:hypothetical protein
MAKGDKGGIFQRLRRGLAKTQGLLIGGADDLLRPGRGMDEALEELLIHPRFPQLQAPFSA